MGLPEAGQVEASVAALLAANPTPGIAAAVSLAGEVVWSRGFGWAWIEQGRPATADTMFSIQSISKSYASVLVMKLVERGLVALDRPLVEYLPDFRTSDRAASDHITVRQVLSHSAGFPGDVGIANAICPNRAEHPWVKQTCLEQGITDADLVSIRTRADITRYFSRVNLAYEPGDGWCYCTDAYAIIGDLYDRVAGESWEAGLTREVLAPLGLTRTTFDPARVVADADAARYYVASDEPARAAGAWAPLPRSQPEDPPRVEARRWCPVPFPINPLAAPIGFVYSSAADLVRFLDALMLYDDSPLRLSRQTLREMHTPVARTEQEGAEFAGAGYALGLGTARHRGLSLLRHRGGYTGVSATVLMVPERRLGVAVLANCDPAPDADVARTIIDVYLDRLGTGRE